MALTFENLYLWTLTWDSAKCRICRLIADNAQPAERERRHQRVALCPDALLQLACRAEDALRLTLARRCDFCMFSNARGAIFLYEDALRLTLASLVGALAPHVSDIPYYFIT